jgi:hypothetical protein
VLEDEAATKADEGKITLLEEAEKRLQESLTFLTEAEYPSDYKYVTQHLTSVHAALSTAKKSSNPPPTPPNTK